MPLVRTAPQSLIQRALPFLPLLALVFLAAYALLGPDPQATTVVVLVAILLTVIVLHQIRKLQAALAQALEATVEEHHRDQENYRNLLTLAGADSLRFLTPRAHVHQHPHPLLRRLGHDTMTAVLANLPTVGPQQITFAGEFLIWESYRELWRALIQDQEASNEAIEVCAVHSMPFEIWNSPRGRDSLDQQSAYIRAGGKIRRYLVGPSLDAEPSERSESPGQARNQVIRSMVEIGITVYYVPYPLLMAYEVKELTDTIGGSGAWSGLLQLADFLWIVDGDWAYQWTGMLDATQARMVLKRSDDFDHFPRLWTTFSQLIEEQNLRPASLPSSPRAAEAA